jgi:putative copper resistance protein D
MAGETAKPRPRRLPHLPLLFAGSVGVAITVTAVAVWAGGDADVEIPGIPDAGAMTAWGLPVARTTADAAAVATVGALLLVVVLLSGRKRLSPTQLRYLNWAAVTAALWVTASVAALTFTLSDLFAQPVWNIASPAVLADFVTTDAQGRSYALMAATAAVIATFCVGIGTARWARLALLLAIAGLLPPVFTGHSSAAGNHAAAVTSLALHLVGVAVWVGGLVFVLVVAARSEDQAADAARRFSPLAAWALFAVAASGIVNAAVRLPSVGDAFTSPYGLMVLGKAMALAVLGGIGWWHRSRTLPALKEGSRRGFVRLAAGELLLMAATVGLAVGLSRTPAPGAGDGSLSPTEELLGFSMPPPLGDFPWTPLFTQWHFDPLFAFGTAAAALLYLAGVRKLWARGDKWPVGRTISWLLGLAVTGAATMSGLAVYGKVLFSVHMGQHMILAMTVPILLVLGAPATLALRALPTSMALIFLPYGLVAALIALVAGTCLAGLFVSSQGSPRIRVTGELLVAGDARIPLNALGEAQVFEGEEARAWRTYKADMRAFMLMRSYVTTAVRVEVIDPDDPTPYVYLSTRTPDRLAEAIRASA